MTKEEKINIITKIKTLIQFAEMNLQNSKDCIQSFSDEYDIENISFGFKTVSSELDEVRNKILDLEEEIEQESE